MSDEKEKSEFLNLFEYLVSKEGKKYLKLTTNPKLNEAEKKVVEAVRTAIGGDILMVNLFDDNFRSQYNIPIFKRGNVSVRLGQSADNKTGVDF